MYRLALTVCVCVVTAAVVVAAGAASGENQAAAVPPQNAAGGPVVESPSGQFLGSWMRSRRGRRFQAYRGIKYAAPPVGVLRFQPPRPLVHYPAPVDATADGPRCPQPLPAGRLVDEDCLMLNVYTPASNGSNSLPVIVYIHAGGFYSMTSRSDVVGPEYLLDRDLVLVTINYRIGSLGFLALGTKKAPGNNGFKDQVVALQWVQRNIAAFGGNPNLVTIAGCSAGSVSVMLHMISPMSKGLFHRAISMSGSPSSKVPAPPHRLDLAEKQARISNCSVDCPEAIYSCLQTKTWQEIAGSMLGFFEFGFDPLSLWRPVVEPNFGQERFLTEDSMEAIRAGRMYDVPFIISQTRDEFYWKAFTVLRNATLLSTMNREWERIAPISFILPRDDGPSTAAAVRRLKAAYFKHLPGLRLSDDAQSADALGKLYGDAITGFPVHRMANLMCRHSKQPVWYYKLEYRGRHSHYEDPSTTSKYRGNHSHYEDPSTTSKYYKLEYRGNHSHYEDPSTTSKYRGHHSHYEDPSTTSKYYKLEYRGNHSHYEDPSTTSKYRGHHSHYEDPSTTSKYYKLEYRGNHSHYEDPSTTSKYRGHHSHYEDPSTTSKYRGHHSHYEDPSTTNKYRGHHSHYEDPSTTSKYYKLEYRGNHSHYEDPSTTTDSSACSSARVAHHDDLIYLFTLRYRQPPLEVAHTEDSRMVDKMTAIWYNFARYGDPNPRIDTPEIRTLSWPAMTPEDRKYLQLSSTFSVHSRLFEERFKVWEELYPIKY